MLTIYAAGGDVQKTLRRLDRAAADLVRRHRSAIQAMADAVMIRRELKGVNLAEALERALSSSPTIVRYGAKAREADYQAGEA